MVVLNDTKGERRPGKETVHLHPNQVGNDYFFTRT